ncbi:hypothetical protein JCM30471_27500 [Desulfuromonas carbonis]|uniref:SEC-C metal-binding domain-containing protein n=1 Tax=Desulfuromonas sp. DDH964 TaxID=1823759 RepID=UPI00078B541A|nr:SEC-C metal-binding domain-containing protein [Desulfuromonas sp. DDH964]AMV70931.1 TPR domain/SEC-C motif domain-containing protein [Desulfuromonas sp. DDH964]
MTKTGRNESCPCGSGKKYKKCCLDKDEAVRRDEREALGSVPMAPDDDLQVEPEEEAVDPYMAKLYARFEAAGFDERLTMLREVLHEQQGIEDDVFDLVALLQQSATGEESRPEVNRCLGALRRQRADCWEQNMGYFVNYFLINALALNDTSEIGEYFLQASRQPDRHIDVYCSTIDLLAYHGQHKVLTEGLRLALPLVEKAEGLMSWVAGDIASRLIDCEVLAWVEAGATEADFNALRLVVEEILPEIDVENLRTYAEHLAGRRRVSAEALLDEKNCLDLERLSFLTASFTGYLNRVHGVPWITGLLAGREIYHYLSRREAGELKAPKRSRFGGRFRGPKPPTKGTAHPLCPDPDTLDRFIANQLHLFCNAYHAVAVLAQHLPAWNDFLEEREVEELDKSRGGLRPLATLIETLVRVLEKGSGDPALAPAVRQAWAGIV